MVIGTIRSTRPCRLGSDHMSRFDLASSWQTVLQRRPGRLLLVAALAAGVAATRAEGQVFNYLDPIVDYSQGGTGSCRMFGRV